MNRILLTSLALSLSLTLVLEILFFLITGKKDKKDMLLVMMVNILTNPVVVLVYWMALLYTDWNKAFIIVPLELFAVLTEGYYYSRYGHRFTHPYIFSLAANAFSYGIGVLIQQL